jgi:hypothetical protein
VLFEGEGDTASMVTLIGSYLQHKEAVKSRKLAIFLAMFPLTGLFGGQNSTDCPRRLLENSVLILSGKRVKNCKASANDAINKLLTPLKHWVKTLTFDNGREVSLKNSLCQSS